ncbi:hypothetical protein QQF64_023438 [Cirrhinus molitorella]|uniref:Uncharacterized protein n=1 Tax=Cirrhinus molitorella TaxID=172907 RepID=A0ABR3L5G2_9TELE
MGSGQSAPHRLLLMNKSPVQTQTQATSTPIRRWRRRGGSVNHPTAEQDCMSVYPDPLEEKTELKVTHVI